ncbi:MAG: signal recognition particle-docking protein FtsY [Planctomycetales bacterium]|nr:signal recognition particle-docking protein FtsY [Planctomycetales bacterium]
MGLLDKFKQGLNKTRQLLKTDVRDLFRSEGRLIDDEFLDDLMAILIKTDMGYKAADLIIEELRTTMRGRVVTVDEVETRWKAKLKELMAQDQSPIRFAAAGPTVIMVCGVNGAGKTTSIAKLTQQMISEGRSVVLGAADTFRAAAVQQLTVWAQRLGAEIVTGEQGTHPATVAYKAVERALAAGADVCIVDTAGRLQTQGNLMAELTKIQTSIRKQIPDAPHEVILTLDATTGQNGISQATNFTEAVDCSGIVLAKLDGTAKGGVVVAIRQEVGLPVKYVGVGEQPEDIALFVPDEFVDALFDEGAAR